MFQTTTQAILHPRCLLNSFLSRLFLFAGGVSHGGFLRLSCLFISVMNVKSSTQPLVPAAQPVHHSVRSSIVPIPCNHFVKASYHKACLVSVAPDTASSVGSSSSFHLSQCSTGLLAPSKQPRGYPVRAATAITLYTPKERSATFNFFFLM